VRVCVHAYTDTPTHSHTVYEYLRVTVCACVFMYMDYADRQTLCHITLQRLLLGSSRSARRAGGVRSSVRGRQKGVAKMIHFFVPGTMIVDNSSHVCCALCVCRKYVSMRVVHKSQIGLILCAHAIMLVQILYTQSDTY